MLERSLFARACALALIGFLAACSAGGQGSSALGSANGSLPLAVPAAKLADETARPTLFVGIGHNALNGGRGAVAVYASGATSPARIIDAKVDGPAALVTDAEGNLFVANNTRGDVTEYSSKDGSLVRLIGKEIFEPLAMAFDADGRLAVANSGRSLKGWVTIYAPGTFQVAAKITQGITSPRTLAFDAAGDLFVANFDDTGADPSGTNVTVYPHGSLKPGRIIPLGNVAPQRIAVGSDGTLYVAGTQLYGGKVLVVPAGASSPSVTISSDRFAAPTSLALDGSGNLYVMYASMNGTGNSKVTVYAPRSSTVLRTITKGVGIPTAMVIDSAGSTYLANGGICSAKRCADPNVTVFAPNGSIARVIRHGTDRPTLLTLGK